MHKVLWLAGGHGGAGYMMLFSANGQSMSTRDSRSRCKKLSHVGFKSQKLHLTKEGENVRNKNCMPYLIRRKTPA